MAPVGATTRRRHDQTGHTCLEAPEHCGRRDGLRALAEKFGLRNRLVTGLCLRTRTAQAPSVGCNERRTAPELPPERPSPGSSATVQAARSGFVLTGRGRAARRLSQPYSEAQLSKYRLGLERDRPSGRQEQDPAGLGAARSVRVPAADPDMAERAPNVPCIVFQCRFAKDLFCAVPNTTWAL